MTGFIAPTMQELQQRRLVGIEPLERLALDVRDNRCNEPLRLAHLDHSDDCAILLREVRDLLASKGCDMGALRQALSVSGSAFKLGQRR